MRDQRSACSLADAGVEQARQALETRFSEVRQLTVQLCATLEVEDYVIQSMPDASPAKWHLAHTTWFFETFVLAGLPGHRPHQPLFGFLFNSYYQTLGERWQRGARGILSRPTVREVFDYRRAIDEQMRQFLRTAGNANWAAVAPAVELGLHHEQQHQELLLTDLKHAFASNPLQPVYRDSPTSTASAAAALEWTTWPAGVRWIGAEAGFAFDNESPRHRVFVEGFCLASRTATCGEFLAFMEDGGYQRPELWLSDGWNARSVQGWTAPLYWEKSADQWRLMTLGGSRPLDREEPLCHVSYYEADAFARWAGARLPTEAEWETAASEQPVSGNFLDSGLLHPSAAAGAGQFFGDVWEWTASPYVAYPGYVPPAGALGEYNGKFMCNQMVLRGGSCVTPLSHIRASYRNFYPPEARWQFSGLRLAKDA